MAESDSSMDGFLRSQDTQSELGSHPMLLPDSRPELFNLEDFMKEKLPPYIVRCFLAAGFDSMDVIASMNISESASNSITVIESFIEKYYSGNEDYCCGPVTPFVFPPGHRVHIQNFVSEVKLKFKMLNTKRSSTSCIKKKRKLPKPADPIVDSDSEEARKKRCMGACLAVILIQNLVHQHLFHPRFVLVLLNG